MGEDPMSDQKKLAIIATKGTLDWAYPPFILASTAAALGYEVQIFWTFYGLQCLKKDLNLQVTSLGNPGMPMPMPMPVMLQALPGMQAMMTSMMKAKMKKKGVASIAELRELCVEAEVKMIACQMTVDLFDMNPSDFIEGVEFGGAATFFEFAGEADITLYI
jgi:peroxiredoxin family protein